MVPVKNSQQMTMTASIESVLELSQGKINSEQFINAYVRASIEILN